MAEPERGAEAVPEAANDASRGAARRTGARGSGIAGRIKGSGPLGWLLLGLGLVGAVLLVVADFSEISSREIGIGACDDRTQAAGVCSTVAHSQHGYALVILGVLALVMIWGAVVGRSRAASVAVAAVGLTVLGIALIGDYPDRNDTRGLEARYTDVSAKLGPAFRLELVGGVLLVLVGGLALVRPEQREPWARREREPREPREPRKRRAARRGASRQTAEERRLERQRAREAADLAALPAPAPKQQPPPPPDLPDPQV